MNTPQRVVFALAGLAVASLVPLFAASAEPKLTRSDDRIRVELGGQLFTEYIFKGAPRPYLYPILAADGTPLSRDYPMKKDTPGEETDHPHHRSLWFTHGEVNGVDFWAEGPNKGLIVSESVDASVKGGDAVISARNRWTTVAGDVVLTDATTIRIRAVPQGRELDYEVTLKAPADKPVHFGDTKEGSMAIRLPAWMTPSHSYNKKKTDGKGTIVNDSGVRDAATWGKRSKWVDYYAPKDGKVYGVAMFDHPSNPRHPTWWHVRDYGLFAANPFGQHDFESLKNNPKAGDMTIPAGGSVTFRYRVLFHVGDEKAAQVAERFQAYASGK